MRPPDDAGWFVNLGAQRLRERGRLPYGDPLLTGTPGAAYGPLLYAAHVPFQVALSPEPVNAVSPARPNLTSGTPYYMPPLLATQLCTIFFHIAGVLALFAAARRLADTQGRMGPRLPLLWQPRGSGHRWARGSSGGDHVRFAHCARVDDAPRICGARLTGDVRRVARDECRASASTLRSWRLPGLGSTGTIERSVYAS